MNKELMRTGFSIFLLLTGLFTGPASAELIRIGSDKQLFFDDYLIESLSNARRVLNPAEKAENNPIIRPDRPWEGKEVRVSYVIFDEKDQIFKMWYTAPTFGARREGKEIIYQESGGPACLATSKDGIHWEKPVLGMADFQGSRQNNIIPERNFMPFFVQDLHEQNPARRYKGLIRRGSMQTPGMQFDLYFSADGFRWTPYEENPVIDTSPRIGRWGPTSFMGWDPVRRTYAAHMENCYHHHCPLGKRLIGRAESPDMIHWSQPETILVPDEHDFPETEFYCMPVFPYEGFDVGLLWNFRTTNTSILPQAVFSRDGIHYNREFRAPVIQPGAHGEFDSSVIYVESALAHRDRIFLYYTGANWRADESLLNLGEKATGAIGLAILPRDGFVSVDGAKTPGEVLTRSFTFTGSRLYLNVRAVLEGNGGAGPCEVKVEILGPDHFPVPGFALEDADRITTTAGARIVSWKGKSNLNDLAGKPVKLRFHFKNAKLYSFQFQ